MLQRDRSTRLKILALAAVPLLLAGRERALLIPAGSVGGARRGLIDIAAGLMLLIIVPVMILTAVFAWRYRKGKGGTYDPNFDHSTSLELVLWAARSGER